uniref:Pleiotropic drug resistance protein 2 n=1 Tax=Cajanus cajan TaxID=3821 RepID=A0A151SIV9_CAJCA|nr:putative pleiotropic drug resistance protein 2 [Cajanus cajan]
MLKQGSDQLCHMICAKVCYESQVIELFNLLMWQILGLDICADTLVGDEMLRGISGGQRKRVTTGEMLVGPANALFMDEISTGLVRSTTLQIVESNPFCDL